MIFSLLTGWMVDRWSFTPVFVLFGVIPVISALLIWRLPDRVD
jgi:MFS transporter, ACS family, hexuronate transporter